MNFTVRFLHIQWFDEHPVEDVEGQNAYPECDGMAVYEVSDGEHTMPMNQPFSRLGQRVGQHRGANFHVWAWNGDRDAPTLTQSYRCRFRLAGIDYNVHLNLTGGRIELHADTTPSMIVV